MSSGRDQRPAELEPAAHGPFAAGGGTARSSNGKDCASLVKSTVASGCGFFAALMSCFWAPPAPPRVPSPAPVATAWSPLTPAPHCLAPEGADVPPGARLERWPCSQALLPTALGATAWLPLTPAPACLAPADAPSGARVHCLPFSTVFQALLPPSGWPGRPGRPFAS